MQIDAFQFDNGNKLNDPIVRSLNIEAGCIF